MSFEQPPPPLPHTLSFFLPLFKGGKIKYLIYFLTYKKHVGILYFEDYHPTGFGHQQTWKDFPQQSIFEKPIDIKEI